MNKIQNTKDLAYYNNAILLSKLINVEVAQAKVDQAQCANLELMQTLIIDILFYVNNLQTHFANSKIKNSKLRELRNECLLKVNELTEEIEWIEKNQI
tara:strand:+ start:262 stop:555 length:294 start_codon:yes stop_codon:yes gene_type:complete